MNLKEYAKHHGIQYRAAWNRFKAGKIPHARQDDFGRIMIDNPSHKPEYTAIYCRVSSSQNKPNLEKQKDRLVQYCIAKGYNVDSIIMETASGLNDKRPKLLKLLNNDSVTRVVVEHSDRLTRFGMQYLMVLFEHKNIELDIVNKAETDKDDLMQDFVSLVTSFTARLYGLRRTKRKTEALIKELNNETA